MRALRGIAVCIAFCGLALTILRSQTLNSTDSWGESTTITPLQIIIGAIGCGIILWLAVKLLIFVWKYGNIGFAYLGWIAWAGVALIFFFPPMFFVVTAIETWVGWRIAHQRPSRVNAPVYSSAPQRPSDIEGRATLVQNNPTPQIKRERSAAGKAADARNAQKTAEARARRLSNVGQQRRSAERYMRSS